ncbi:MAG: hypothetical protein AAB930_00885 [Patescibacteria group bacterium]
MKTKINLIRITVSISSMILPFIAVAAASDITDILQQFIGIISVGINLLMVLATVIFLWGVITYITASGVEEKIKEGRTYMLWGIIGLFVMVAVWGLVAVLGATFPGANTTSDIPEGPQ